MNGTVAVAAERKKGDEGNDGEGEGEPLEGGGDDGDDGGNGDGSGSLLFFAFMCCSCTSFSAGFSRWTTGGTDWDGAASANKLFVSPSIMLWVIWEKKVVWASTRGATTLMSSVNIPRILSSFGMT